MFLTIIFCVLISVAFVTFLGFALEGRESSSSRAARLGSIGPGVLTSLGILGTFFGIIVGLWSFDVQRVDESVPALLEGLKAAFISSGLGLTFALIFRTLQPVLIPVETGSDDPLEVLNSILKENIEQSKALSGGEDTSLLTQIQKLRTTISDGQDSQLKSIEAGFEKQIRAFSDFADKVAENNSQALIDALNEVIRDFNQKITEQFGENFQQLNEAVGLLLEWQVRYKAHVEETENALKTISQDIVKSGEALATVAKTFEDIPRTGETVEKLIAQINGQLQITGNMAEGVGELRRELSGALPEIQQTIDRLTSEFATEVDKAAKALSSSAEDAAQHYQVASQQLSDGFSKLQASLDGSFEQFDRAMQEELTRALSLMGRQLASISEKIADDYDKLARGLSGEAI